MVGKMLLSKNKFGLLLKERISAEQNLISEV